MDPLNFTKELCENIINNFNQYELSLKMRIEREKNKGLCLSDYEYFENDNTYSEQVVKKLMIKSSQNIKSLGSATCTIILLDKLAGKIFTCSIGDSCYMILEYNCENNKFEKKFKSDEQMHTEFFNTPYQIGIECDDPEMSITRTHKLNEFDLVISATDG